MTIAKLVSKENNLFNEKNHNIKSLIILECFILNFIISLKNMTTKYFTFSVKINIIKISTQISSHSHLYTNLVNIPLKTMRTKSILFPHPIKIVTYYQNKKVTNKPLN